MCVAASHNMVTMSGMEPEALRVERTPIPGRERRVRVLHVTQSTVAGVATHVLQIIGNIDSRRFESHLICPPATPLAADAAALGATLLPLALSRNPSLVADLRALNVIRAMIGSGTFDIVHTHSSKGGFIGRLAATLARHPRVVHTPNAFYYIGQRGLKRLVYQSLERIARPWTDRLIATSQSEQLSAVNDLRFSPDTVRQINNSIELPGAMIRKADQLPTHPMLLFAGRISDQKNPEMFVRMSQVVAQRQPQARFAMIGLTDGDLHSARVRAMIAEYGLNERYMLDGWLDRDETLRRIARCTVFVIPSRYEGCCYIAAEAMALGVPVVATDVAGLREVVADGESGFLVPTDDHEAAAERVLQLLGDSDRRQRMGQHGIERVTRLFNVTDTIKQLERVYLELLSHATEER